MINFCGRTPLLLILVVMGAGALYFPFTRGLHPYRSGRGSHASGARHLLESGTLQLDGCDTFASAPSATQFKAFLSPLWPLITAGAMRLHWADSYQSSALIKIEVGLHLLTGVILFFIYGTFVGGSLGALTLSILYYSFHGFFNLSTEYYLEPLYTFLLFLFLWMALRAWRSKSVWDAAISGVALGLSILTKPTPLFLLGPLTLGWIIHAAYRRKSPYNSWTLGLVIAWMVVLPWGVRNYREVGYWVISTTNSGHNLYLGAIEDFPRGNRFAKGTSIFLRCSPTLGPVIGEVERSRLMMHLAWEEIKKQPFRYLSARSGIFLKETLMPSISSDYIDPTDPEVTPNHLKAWFIPQFPKAAEFVFCFLFLSGLYAAAFKRKATLVPLLLVFLLGNALSSLPFYKLRFFLPYLPIYFGVVIFGAENLIDTLIKRVKSHASY